MPYEFPQQPEMEVWQPPKAEPASLPPEEFAAWKLAVTTVRGIAQRDGLTKSEVARRSAIPMGTFSPWYDGSYTGKIASITERVERWIRAVEERLRVAGDVQEPGFIETPTAGKVIETLIYAQTLAEMSVVTLGAGMGKTMLAAEMYARRATLADVARQTNVSAHALCDWRSRHMPRLDLIEAALNAVGLELCVRRRGSGEVLTP